MSNMVEALCTANLVRRLLFDEEVMESEEVDDSDADSIYYPSSETSDSENNEHVQPARVTSRSPKPTPKKALPSRKRKRSISKKEFNKERRNEGRSYKNTKRQLVDGHFIGVFCNCPLHCQDKLQPVKNELFNGFWDLSSFDKQNAYLFGLIEAYDVKRRYGETSPGSSRRQKSYYFKVNIDGSLQRICRKSFLAVHGLQNNRGRLNNILKQVKSNCTPKNDQRGKHDNRPNRITEDRIATVHSHLKTIPVYQSHYSRLQNPNKVYFDCDLNISSLYRDYYIDFCKQKDLEPVVEDRYRRIFNEEYNIGFKIPKSDTCKTCDMLNIIINSSTSDEDEKNEAKRSKELHLRKAEAMRQKLTEYSMLAKEDPHKVHVISIDLQQTLPTPKLTCGPAFYLRKLWTYNVGIHDCGKDSGYMFMWDESVAKRGSDEIGSCLKKYLDSTNIQGEKLVIFSDNCGGQNKNYNIASLYSYLTATGIFKEVEHYFLITGHTFLPSDRDFAKIEKLQKHHTSVYTPEQWMDLVSKSSHKKKCIVTRMKNEDIFDLTDLKTKFCSIKTKTTNGDNVNFSKAICIKFEQQDSKTMKIKHHLNTEFCNVSLKKEENQTQSHDTR